MKRGLEIVSLFGYLYFVFCEILGNMCIAMVCKPGCDVMNFEVNLIFLIKPFFLHEQKLVTKTYLENEKSIFHHFLKGFQSCK